MTLDPLSERQKRHLRGRGHALHPLVRIGQAGLTDSLVQETERALRAHELIKVRTPPLERTAREALLRELAQRTGSSLVQRIGNIGLLYRAHATAPKLQLPEP